MIIRTAAGNLINSDKIKRYEIGVYSGQHDRPYWEADCSIYVEYEDKGTETLMECHGIQEAQVELGKLFEAFEQRYATYAFPRS